MKNIIKIAGRRSSYAPNKYVLFDGNTARATDSDIHVTVQGAWNVSPARLVPVDILKAAVKINKLLTFTDTTLNGITLPDNGSSVSDFVPLPALGDCTGSLETVNLDRIKGISLAAAVKDVRQVLHGVCFDARDAVIMACDGHRLHVAQSIKYTGEHGAAIVPNDAIAYGLTGKMSRIAFYKAHAALEYPGARIVCKLIDGRFPDWQRVYPKISTPRTTGNLSALKNCAAVSSSDKYKACVIDQTRGTIATDGEGFSAAFCDIAADGTRAGFTSDYVIDAFYKADSIEFQLQDPNSSGLFHNPLFDAVIMPLRVGVAYKAPASEATTTPASEATTTPASEATTTPASEATTTPASDATTTPASDATTTPASDATTTPASDATVTPASDATVTPASDATVTPASDATVTPAAKKLAVKTSDAYSADRYGCTCWIKCAALLLANGFTEEEAEAQLRSKNMRWAADGAKRETRSARYDAFAAMLMRNMDAMRAEAKRWIRVQDDVPVKRKALAPLPKTSEVFAPSDIPCAPQGLTSYRYAGYYGWIMIAADCEADALKQAALSTAYPIERNRLQIWDGMKYIPILTSDA